MGMSQLLEDFILGALLGDRESEDWALAMLGPWREGETGPRGWEGALPPFMRGASPRPTEPGEGLGGINAGPYIPEKHGRIEDMIEHPFYRLEDGPPRVQLASTAAVSRSQTAQVPESAPNYKAEYERMAEEMDSATEAPPQEAAP